MDHTFSPEELARLRAFLQVTPTVVSTAPPLTDQIPAPAVIPSVSLFSQPPSQPLSSLTTQPPGPPPVTTLYQSSRQQLPPQRQSSAALGSATAMFQPFSGIGLNLPTGHANQARMASASNTIPRSVTLPRRTSRRTRGPAQNPPVLGQARKPSIDDCLVSGTTIRIKIFVYLPIVKSKQQYLVYRFLKDSFENWMNQSCLCYCEEVALSESFISIVSRVVVMMQSSHMQFRFAQPCHPSLVAPHENLALQLLRPNSRGTRSSKSRIVLRPEPISASSLLSDVVRELVGTGTVGLEQNIDGDRFVLRLGIRSSPIIHIKDGRKHRCLPRHFYASFRNDGDAVGPSRGESDDDEPSSGGEAGTDDEIEEEQHSYPQSVRVRSEPSINTMMSFLPPAIWQGERSPSTMAGSQATYSITELASRVYHHTFPKLVVEGTSIQDLARVYDAILTEAVKSNDFSRLLASDREFNLHNSQQRLFSFGPGIEREVIFTTFCGYLVEPSQWFLPLADNAASLQTSARFFLSRTITQNRFEDMKKLGALCALLLINGQCPEPFNPLLFQYIIHDCDLHSLHEHLVGEWHPELRATIRQWIDMGETGDVTPFRSHFASFHNQSIGILRGRSKEMHDKIGAEMLYNALLGSEPPSHPEWTAFREGFSLSCANGFDFCKIPKLFEGGSEPFFSLLWTAKITGFDSIKAHLTFLRPPAGFLPHLEVVTGQVDLSVADLITSFLQGSGIPCPEQFDAVREGFSSLINLSQIDDPAFRPRVFVWAVTGCPHIDPASDPIIIGIVSEDDHLYASNPAQAAIMAAHGKISFRTCLQSARLPASFVRTLATAIYPLPHGPQNFQQAFDHWMLCELLNGIGGISML